VVVVSLPKNKSDRTNGENCRGEERSNFSDTVVAVVAEWKVGGSIIVFSYSKKQSIFGIILKSDCEFVCRLLCTLFREDL
jgi:hypothetical protein